MSPTNTAISPRFGVTLACEVLPLGEQQRFFNLEIFTTDGIVNQVIPNPTAVPINESIQRGTEIENMLPGKFKVQRLGKVWFSQIENINKKNKSAPKNYKKVIKTRY